MLRKIVLFGDPVLETVCEPVDEAEFDKPEFHALVGDMFETMYAAEGVGLAAPQIGIAKRLTVIDCSGPETRSEPHVLVNPEITRREGEQVGSEGCLSIPGFTANVSRPDTVQVRFRTVDGGHAEIEASGLLARAICHENDHLNGILFLKHLGRLRRGIIMKKIRNLKKQGEWS